MIVKTKPQYSQNKRKTSNDKTLQAAANRQAQLDLIRELQAELALFKKIVQLWLDGRL